MSIFNFRDSWEVWRKKVDIALGGSVEDIKASEVIFDKTGTTLTSSDVQGALVELDAKDGVQAEDITGLKERATALENKISNKIVMTDNNYTISVTADGVKTYAELLTSLGSDILTEVQALSANESIVIKKLVIPALRLDIVAGNYLDNEATTINIAFQRIDVSGASQYLYLVKINDGGTSAYNKSVQTASGLTFDPQTSVVPAADSSLYVICEKYIKL